MEAPGASSAGPGHACRGHIRCHGPAMGGVTIVDRTARRPDRRETAGKGPVLAWRHAELPNTADAGEVDALKSRAAVAADRELVDRAGTETGSRLIADRLGGGLPGL